MATTSSADLQKSFDTFRTQTIIVESVLGGIILVLICGIIFLFIWRRNLMKLVKVLDPVSSYKKVGPSLYVKRGKSDAASLSSSFKQYESREASTTLADDDAEKGKNRNNKNVGTLDRNFFTNTNFSFEGEDAWPKEGTSKSANSKRRTSQEEAMEAITKLDKVLY